MLKKEIEGILEWGDSGQRVLLDPITYRASVLNVVDMEF